MTITESDLRTAFKLGFMVSREGFNGECDYEHLAPGNLKTCVKMFRKTIPEFFLYIKKSEAFQKLEDEAMNLFWTRNSHD